MSHPSFSLEQPSTPSAPTTPSDDREALVRFDLIDTAKRANLKCVALVIGVASSMEHWLAVSHDFRRAGLAAGSRVPGLYTAHEAAECLAGGDIELALRKLAASCGVPVLEWLDATAAARAASEVA